MIEKKLALLKEFGLLPWLQDTLAVEPRELVEMIDKDFNAMLTLLLSAEHRRAKP